MTKKRNQKRNVKSVEFVIQILKKAAKLASEAEARRREAWAGRSPLAVRIVLGFHLERELGLHLVPK
jgi:hypothetical protein